ncbi:nucleoside-binding protein [Halobacillus karajensis]|uniref:Purine-binding protein n=1 Tax=Halobacillus karajensis TaxID=195088 RepID=A0A024P6Z7_9BACI|nr:BMP family ABC transporter substrate-binding protein [Halobacillus karajensis]CDQ21037.1 Purine-binding protein precursor [Halobacillus karajensis]CDQ24899.1 Purine-binding protein precursor [Halobacillus karajensis]CDQ28741.1 Purine-binding protein precursor [Halobacillus karajensis]SEH97127.1 nucleoside-binding protein [Halobacillus karajensis]
MKIQTIMILSLLFSLVACDGLSLYQKDVKVGMLVETTIHDQAWGQQGYKGLQAIQEEYGVDIYFKEGIRTYNQTVQAVDEFSSKGIEVIFGHSSLYGNHFKELRNAYPDIEFIYFNGQYSAENVTSLNFDSRAMGFFAGMVAGEMTKTDHVGIIGVFEWQPEVEGFYEGVIHQNPDADVEISLTNSWENIDMALMYYDVMKKEGVDVFYPAGDVFNVPVIEQAQNDGNYAIGYVQDQSHVAQNTVLTSTVQKVDEVYKLAMERYMNDELSGEMLTFDFQEGAIQMGEYSPAVPEDIQSDIKELVEQYKETGELPERNL